MTKCTWTGQDHSFEWTESKNWDPQVPGEDDDVLISAGPTFDAPVPPAGTLVKSVRLESGGLQGRLRVKERFEWAGGRLDDGLDLGAAKLVITGKGGQETGANITSADTSLLDTDVKLTTGARFINTGKLASSGSCRLIWSSGANTFLENRSSITVTDGTLTLVDVIGLFDALVTVAPGAVVRIESQTVPSVLRGGALISGGGRLQVGGGGRLYAVSSARIAAGTTIELTTDGSIEDERVPILYAAILGPVPGVQRLTVMGQLLWSGGAIYGEVFLGSQAVLHAEGSPKWQHVGHMLRLTGSGVLIGPGELEVDVATLRNDGDLILQSDLQVSTGRNYVVDNRGTLRVAGAGVVEFGNNKLTNRGTIDLTEGTLHLAVQPGKYTQPRGQLRIADKATLRSDAPLRIDGGGLIGAGKIVGDLEARSQVQPGTPPKPGRLSVEGSCQFAKTTRLHIQIDGTTPAVEHSQLQATKAVTLAGRCEAAAPQYTPVAGDKIEIVAAGPATTIVGRFEDAKLPTAPPGGLFLRPDYRDNNTTLLASSTVLGFDLRDPPANAAMAAFVSAAPYAWVGYYLHAPCHGPSWMGKRAFLTGLGLGLAVIYVGQQTAGASNCLENDTTAGRGQVDAQQAITRASGEGFPPGTWIYLDVEKNPAGPPTAGMLAYVRYWVDEILLDGTFNPGIYLHQSEIGPIHSAAMTAFTAQGRRDRPRYWVVGGPASVSPTDPPSRSGVPEAVVWQQKLDFAETSGGVTLKIDRNVSAVDVVPVDPSAP